MHNPETTAVVIYGERKPSVNEAEVYRRLFGMQRTRLHWMATELLYPGDMAFYRTNRQSVPIAVQCDTMVYSHEQAIRMLAKSGLETYTVLVTMPKAIGANVLRVGIENQLLAMLAHENVEGREPFRVAVVSGDITKPPEENREWISESLQHEAMRNWP